MPMAPSLPSAFRDAVASGEFRRALRLWEEYAGTLAEMARRGTLTEAALQEAAQLVEWARTTALMARAHGCEELAERRATCRVAQVYSANSAG
jgi:hypothetical protein